jgi:hypothetical protein
MAKTVAMIFSQDISTKQQLIVEGYIKKHHKERFLALLISCASCTVVLQTENKDPQLVTWSDQDWVPQKVFFLLNPCRLTVRTKKRNLSKYYHLHLKKMCIIYFNFDLKMNNKFTDSILNRNVL